MACALLCDGCGVRAVHFKHLACSATQLGLIGQLRCLLCDIVALMKALFDALNIVYAEPEKRSFVMLNAVSLAFTLGGPRIALLAIAAMIVLPIALDYLGLGAVTAWILTLGRWPLLLIAISFAIALIYRYGPSRSKPQWQWISWGSAFAAIGD
jgi:membrane protein